MIRELLAGAAFAGLVATTPAFAQQTTPPAQAEVQLVGLPVYSSDGEKLGEVKEVGTVAGQQMLRADMGAFLGLGSNHVLIPAEMFERKEDRIQVSMSAAEVRDTITKQKAQKQQDEQKQ